MSGRGWPTDFPSGSRNLIMLVDDGHPALEQQPNRSFVSPAPSSAVSGARDTKLAGGSVNAQPTFSELHEPTRVGRQQAATRPLYDRTRL